MKVRYIKRPIRKLQLFIKFKFLNGYVLVEMKQRSCSSMYLGEQLELEETLAS